MAFEWIFALAFLQVFGTYLARGPILGFPIAVLLFVIAASISTLVQFVFGFPSGHVLVGLSGTLATIAVGLYAIQNRRMLGYALVSASLVWVLSVIMEWSVRLFGISSVAFTDGHTILERAIEFSSGERALTSGSTALKRGFGLSAGHAQGNENEYLVAFMPIVFIGAVAATLILVREATGKGSTFWFTATILIAGVTLTEAISRHAFLINTHSLAWLAVAVLLVFLNRGVSGPLSTRDWAVLFLIASAVGFLRVDYIFVFSAFFLFLLLLKSNSHWVLAGLPIPLMVISSVGWILYVAEYFPFGGNAGLLTYALLGVTCPLLLAFLLRHRTGNAQLFNGRPFWYAIGAIGLYLLTQVALVSSGKAIATNLFLGEGLWGGFSYFVILAAILGITLSPLETTKPNWLFRMFMLTFLLYVTAKTLDNFEVRGLVAGVSRIGFGDSLNRTLVMWLPFLFLLVARIQTRLRDLSISPKLGAAKKTRNSKS